MAFKRPVATRSRRAARQFVSVAAATTWLRGAQARLAQCALDLAVALDDAHDSPPTAGAIRELCVWRAELEARALELDRHLGLTRALRGESGATPFLLSAALAKLAADVLTLESEGRRCPRREQGEGCA